MIGLLIQKEIRGLLFSWRFIVSLVLILLLFAVSGFIFADTYEHQVTTYAKNSRENLSNFREKATKIYLLPDYYHTFWRHPIPLSLCVGGSERYLPNRVHTGSFMTKLPEVEGQRNFFLRCFSDTDWVFIVSYMMSFLALVLTYDSVCGEKQDGTLRLMLAGALPRSQVLLAKYGAVLVLLLSALLMGMLVCLLIAVPLNGVSFSMSQWGKILGILLVSLGYISLFIWLGLLVSSCTAQSVNSMVSLLVLWVCIILLIPSVGSSVAGTLVNASSGSEYVRQVRQCLPEVQRDYAAGKYGFNKDGSLPDPRDITDNPETDANFWKAYLSALDRIHEKQHNDLLQQAFRARAYASFSPWVTYQRICETLAGTGIGRCQHFVEQIRQYRTELLDYVRRVDALDPNSLHLLHGPDYLIDQFTVLSKRPVNFAAVPKFQERPMAMAHSLKLALWDLGNLILFNMVLFAGAFVSFLRYDVR